MAVLADLERLFERVFERSSARLFRTRLQELQVERRLERAMERARVGQGGRTVVPARYRVRLAAADLEDLAGEAGAEALAGRLADAALVFARAHGYYLPGRPTVSLVIDPAVDRGTAEVDAVGTPGRQAGQHAGSAAPATVPGLRPSPPVPDVPVIAPRPEPGLESRAPAGSVVLEAAPAPGPATAPIGAPAAAAAAAATAAAVLEPDPDHRPGGIRGDGTETLVYRRPAPVPVSAQIRVIARDGGERTVGVDGTPLTLGRAPDNGLVLADGRVSRHHARLQARRGTLVFTDLGSTNGSRVNGIRVDECALGTGDRVQVGDTVLLVEQLPGLTGMDGFVLALWVVRILFLLVIYGFLFAVVRVLLRDLRAASKGPAELGRLIVLASPLGEPQAGGSYPLDAVTTLGRDVNNGIVLDDPFASAEHAVLTYRGRNWYVEDVGSTNGTFVNGVPVEGVGPLGFGDELQVGEIRFRLDRGRA